MASAKSFNSKGENPCEIAGALDAECQGFGAFESTFCIHRNNLRHTDAYTMGHLEQGMRYAIPQRNTSAQRCKCNTVIYRYTANLYVHPDQVLIIELCSLYMACTACQNLPTHSWSFWVQNCDKIYVCEYPGKIPPNTAVPDWAYVDVTVRV
jgi:hypothetical protein